MKLATDIDLGEHSGLSRYAITGAEYTCRVRLERAMVDGPTGDHVPVQDIWSLAVELYEAQKLKQEKLEAIRAWLRG